MVTHTLDQRELSYRTVQRAHNGWLLVGLDWKQRTNADADVLDRDMLPCFACACLLTNGVKRMDR